MLIDDYILAHRAKLNTHPLMHALRGDRGSPSVLSFARDMTFFVLGFRDILELAKVREPLSDAEKALNAHCDEDMEHWRWFLEDLDLLSQISTIDAYDGHPQSLLYSIWSDDQYLIRRHTYRVAALMIGASDADEKLAIMDCLEAAFSEFISALNASTKRSGLYDQLKYFGRMHHIEELGHDRYSKDHCTPLDQVDRSSYSNQLPDKIDEIFRGFDECFTLWHKTLKSQMLKKESESGADLMV